MRNLKGNIAGSLDCARDDGVNGCGERMRSIASFSETQKGDGVIGK